MLRLVAWVVPVAGGSVSWEALRFHLGARLPEPMVPAELVELSPLLADGLADAVQGATRRRLLAAERAADLERLPGDDAEHRMALVHRVGVEDPRHHRRVGADVRRGGKCVAPSRRHTKHKLKRCTRRIRLGSFTHHDRAGTNRFHFTGRLRGRKLKPGTYLLGATVRVSNLASTTLQARFRIRQQTGR